jgi:hypothetical protein
MAGRRVRSKSAAGGGGGGAAINPRYHDRDADFVGVDVNDLKDFKAASIEEFWQFAIGQFFAAGAFWLGLERLLTASNGLKDPLFWICVIAFIAGSIIGYFGYRQLSRRQGRIDRIIEDAMRHMAEKNGAR